MTSLIKSPIPPPNNKNAYLVILQVEKYEICEVLANKYEWLKRYLDFMLDGSKPFFQISTFFITFNPLQNVL